MRIRDLVNPIKAYAATPIKALEGDYYKYLQNPNTFCYIADDGSIKQVSTSDRNNSNIKSHILFASEIVPTEAKLSAFLAVIGNFESLIYFLKIK